MAGQAIERNHSDTVINYIQLPGLLTAQEITPQGADLPEGCGMIEYKQIIWKAALTTEVDLGQPFLHFVYGWWVKPGADQQLTQRIGIVANGHTVRQRCLQGGCAAAHHRVI